MFFWGICEGESGLPVLFLRHLSLSPRVRLLVTPWTAAHQAPPSIGFSRQEYWSRVLLLSLMYSAYKLNKQYTALTYSFSYLKPVYCSTSSSNCCFLTCIQISQEAGQVVWYSHLFKNFPEFVVIHTVKSFGVVNKAEVDVFLELSFFFYDHSQCFRRTSWPGFKTFLSKVTALPTEQLLPPFLLYQSVLCCYVLNCSGYFVQWNHTIGVLCRGSLT